MINISKQDLIELQTISQNKLPEDLEEMVSTQKDALLKCPGVIAHYYRFFYFLTTKFKPSVILELGTDTGISIACLAGGNPNSKIYTVDHTNHLNRNFIKDNVKYLNQDSLKPIDIKNIDILFIDTNHDGIRVYEEYMFYKNKMSENGIIFFDDIYLTEAMKYFWINLVPEKGFKFDLDIHGKAGFGVILLNNQ